MWGGSCVGDAAGAQSNTARSTDRESAAGRCPSAPGCAGARSASASAVPRPRRAAHTLPARRRWILRGMFQNGPRRPSVVHGAPSADPWLRRKAQRQGRCSPLRDGAAAEIPLAHPSPQTPIGVPVPATPSPCGRCTRPRMRSRGRTRRPCRARRARPAYRARCAARAAPLRRAPRSSATPDGAGARRSCAWVSPAPWGRRGDRVTSRHVPSRSIRSSIVTHLKMR